MYEDIHTIEHEGFTIRTTIEPENQEPDWDFENEKQRQALLDQIEAGSMLYFSVAVEAWKNGIKFDTQYLGGCCHETLQDFIDNGGYYNDMVQDAIDKAKLEIKGLVKDQRQAMQGAIDALTQNKTFPADIECAKNLLKTALAA